MDNLNQLKQIIGLKFDRVLFDNMNVKNLRKAVNLAKNRYETEASGGVTLKNIKKIELDFNYDFFEEKITFIFSFLSNLFKTLIRSVRFLNDKELYVFGSFIITLAMSLYW